MSKKIKTISAIILGVACLWLLSQGLFWYRATAAERARQKAQNQAVETIIDSRRIKNFSAENQIIDPFGKDKIARVLLIGLDTRAGEKNGHCDAIQLISIDNNAGAVTITAVPRGTYSPLPPGTGSIPSDYYVSNACGLGGLDYGIKQIEKILGVKADYLVVVGFSETLGILRQLRLPTTETLQWLRNRHGYAIGEPQRAHNHSMFIKQLLTEFVPLKESKMETAWQYILYKSLKTDLSFAQAQALVKAISAMDTINHPEKIKLAMQPLFPVQDIPYDPKLINEYLDQTLGPIKNILPKDDYSNASTDTVQTKLLTIIGKNFNNPEFVSWAYQSNLWLQIEDHDNRLVVQFDLLKHYLPLVTKQERESAIADYIVEMENRNESTWQEKGKGLLKQELGS